MKTPRGIIDQDVSQSQSVANLSKYGRSGIGIGEVANQRESFRWIKPFFRDPRKYGAVAIDH